MNSNIKTVAAGIIENDCEILIARRRGDGLVGGLWEFPGGKQEDGETIEECLIREIKEEFDLIISTCGIIGESTYTYAHGSFKLVGIKAKSKSRNIKLSVHDESAWVKSSELNNYEFAPADIPLVKIVVGNIL